MKLVCLEISKVYVRYLSFLNKKKVENFLITGRQFRFRDVKVCGF